MKNLDSIEPALQAGLNFLVSLQLADGSFAGQSSPAGQPWQAQQTYHTTFDAAIMLSSLTGVVEAADICDQLAKFLLDQKSPQWSFNYWSKSAPQKQSLPYPDDLDDTFCALIALFQYQPSLIDGSVLAQVTRLLVACEQSPGGPYYTWLSPANSATVWRDIDLAVNSNVASFLQLINVKLPNLDNYLSKHLDGAKFDSQYYPSNWPIWYYLSRWCPTAKSAQLRGVIEQSLIRQSAIGAVRLSPLQTALCLTSLCQLDSHDWLLQALASRLVAAQQADGSWPAAGFCLDPAFGKQIMEHGSAALTTALALEALTAFTKIQSVLPATGKHMSTSPKRQRRAAIKLAVHQNVRQFYSQFSSELSQPVQPMLERLGSNDNGDQICLLAHRFAQSLAIDSALLNLNTFVELGAANLLGWVAYSVYDDILDDQAVPAQLPAANAGMRASQAKFKAIFANNAAFLAYIDHTFDSIDQANAWEVNHCRAVLHGDYLEIPDLPNYGDRSTLADRSFGHALAPLGVLILNGSKLADTAVQSVQLGFRHYLIARQLSDDLHDWSSDLASGHLSYVVSEVIRELGMTGTWPRADLLEVVRRQFWHHTINNIGDVIGYHLEQAERNFQAGRLLGDEKFTDWLLGPLRVSLKNTRSNQKEILGFLRSYRASATPRLLTLS